MGFVSISTTKSLGIPKEDLKIKVFSDGRCFLTAPLFKSMGIEKDAVTSIDLQVDTDKKTFRFKVDKKSKMHSRNGTFNVGKEIGNLLTTWYKDITEPTPSVKKPNSIAFRVTVELKDDGFWYPVVDE